MEPKRRSWAVKTVRQFPQNNEKTSRQKLWRYLNIALALVLLGWVLRDVGIEELTNLFKDANPALLVLCVVLSPPGVILNALKWQGLLRAQGFHISLIELYQISLAAIFFNSFLPSSVGGDVIRISEVGKRINDPASAAAAVFVDRLIGFIVLILLAAISLLVRFFNSDSLPLSLFILLALGGITAIAWFAFDSRLLGWLVQRVKIAPAQKILGKFVKFQAALSKYKNQPRAIVTALFWSVCFYLQAALIIYVAALAFAPGTPFIDVALTVPITMTVAAMPFAINGIGLQEWSYVLLFPMIGLPGSVGLSTILVIRFETFVLILLGGLIYLRMRIRNEQKFDQQTLTPSVLQSSDISV